MTSLRFVGDLPLWLGLALSVVVGALSWMYYNRESFELPRRLRIILPLLRASAFVLGILILTGPVLHHRKTVGELGKVKVFVDWSQSMTQRDKHMALARKLRIASQLGWITDTLPEFPELEVIESISRNRIALLRVLERESEQPSENAEPASKRNIAIAVNQFVEDLDIVNRLSAESTLEFQSKVLTPLKSRGEATDELDPDRIRIILADCAQAERAALAKINSEIQLKISEKEGSLATAIDLFDESPRWRRMAMALQDRKSDAGQSVLDSLRSRHDVELFLMNQPGSSTTLIESSQLLPVEGNLESDRFIDSTDLNRRIYSSLEPNGEKAGDNGNQQNGQTAIILLSDGRHNLGPSPIQLARELNGQGYAFFNVGIGADSPAVDLAVIKVEHPKLVFKKDEVRGSITIRDSMTPGKPFVAQIKHGDKLLWQKQLVAQDTRDRQVNFQFRVDDLIDELNAAGSGVQKHIQQLSLVASITPLAEESETGNNSQPMRVGVITEGYKVLIIDGRSRWETRFIRNAFQRDEQWDVRTILAGKSTSHPTLPRGDEAGKFPSTRQELFEFDLIVWGEVDSELLDEKEFEWIAEFVESRGGGIVFIDGLRGKLRQLESTALSDLLPVLSIKQPLTRIPEKLQLTSTGVDQPALALNIDRDENQQFWTELPPPKTLIPIEPTADSTVLVNATIGADQYPAIVTKSYGAGRVLYLSFDETWRWRYKTADTWHQRAWQQLAKFAMPQPFSVSDEYVSIDSGSASYEFDERPVVRVKLKGLDGKPNSDAIVDALIWKDGKVVSTVNLESDANVPGLYRNRLEQLEPGEYEVSIRASGYQESILESRSRFLVLRPESGELSETSVNEELLDQMAAESGGRYLKEEELFKLPELLAPFSNGRVIESETVLWQSYWWFSAMILLLTIEWVLRKRAGLL